MEGKQRMEAPDIARSSKRRDRDEETEQKTRAEGREQARLRN